MAKPTEALEDGISKLPQPIMHHILSFLEPKEAAKTSLISKAWLNTWYTRPILDFMYKPCGIHPNINNFMNYIDTTLLRCHKQKNGINTLNLELNNFRFFPPCDFERWLQIAIQNGLKRLRICMNHEFVLPQAVFDGTSLVNLWIGTCQLRPQLIQIIRCHGLRELTLFRVRLDDVMLQRIMSSCPLIEYLDISYCLGLVNIKATKLEKLERLNVFAPAVEHFCYAREVIHEGIQLRHPRLEMHTSRNLKILWLFGISITDEFFLNFGKKFPCLQELRIQKCKDLCRIKILSYTINQVNLECNMGLKEVEIDAPNIDQFKYRGWSIPNFLFAPSSIPRVADIMMSYCHSEILQISYFSKLNNLLTMLSQSKISLGIKFPINLVVLNGDDILIKDATIPLPQVEKLSINLDEIGGLNLVYLIMDCIFLACRPKTIVQSWDEPSYITNNQLLFEMLLFGRRHKHCSLEQTKWQEDLKDVKLKIFRKGDRAAHQEEPQLLGWEKFLKESTTDEGYKWLFVLDLEWKHSTRLDSKIFKISDVGTS